MMPSGPPTPVGGGAQSALPSLLRSNSNLSNNSQQTFNSLVSPRTQFSNNGNSNGMNILGNISNVASLINQSMPNGVGLQHFGNSEPDPLSFSNSHNQQLGTMHNFQQQNGSLSQNGSSSQQLQTMRNMSPQNMQTMRGLGPVKMEPQNTDSSIFLQHQQQQQQMMQMSRQSPQTAMQLNMLQQQQRIMQQQQLFKGLPPRAQMQQSQNILPLRNQVKNSNYEPGICAKRLTQYMYYQKHRPEDNNIEFWRKFVAEFFASNAKKRWCVSLYGNGRQTNGVFPQDVWHCEICNRKPGRGFETTAEVLPRLCQIKYASGTLEELLYVDMPRESQNGMGQIVLDYPKAVQESVFEQLRVVRDGHLRIVFNPDLKIASWEFCARKHEELIPRRLIIPQVGQLGSVVQKYHNAAQNAPTGLSTQELQNNCNSFVASARQLAKALEVPLVNDLGYTKRYVRCLQISEVVNSMKDLIDHSKETGTGPMASLINFPRRNSNLVHPQQDSQQLDSQNQTMSESSNHNSQSFLNENIMQLASRGNSENNLANGAPPNVNSYTNGPSTNSIARLLHHQSSMNSRHETLTNMSQVPSSNSQSQPNPSLPFSPSTPTSNGNHNNNMDAQSSVQQIMHELITASSPTMNGVNSTGNEMNGINGIYGNMGGVGPLGTVSGLRAAMASNNIGMNGRVGMNNNNHMSQNMAGMNHHQQDNNGSDRLMSGLGSINNFSNFNFDWKTSP